MIIDVLEVGVFAENCYVVGCERTRKGIVIDPGDEIQRIMQAVELLQLDIERIVLTHAHLDHVKEVGALQEILEVETLMHKDDLFLLENLPTQAAAFGMTCAGIPRIDAYLDEGDTVQFGDEVLDVLFTPGHSPGSITLTSARLAFVGDVLFAGSIGRTDLPGGNYTVLIETIRRKLIPLGDNTIVYPGHGPQTSIGHERATNPFLVNSNYGT